MPTPFGQYPGGGKIPVERIEQETIDVVQDIVIYFVLALVMGTLLEKIFYVQNPIKTLAETSTIYLIFSTFFQLFLNVLAVNLIRYIDSKIKPLIRVTNRQVPRLEVGIIIPIVFIGSQPSLIVKVQDIISRFSKTGIVGGGGNDSGKPPIVF